MSAAMKIHEANGFTVFPSDIAAGVILTMPDGAINNTVVEILSRNKPATVVIEVAETINTGFEYFLPFTLS
jgi:hypothetical protein